MTDLKYKNNFKYKFTQGNHLAIHAVGIKYFVHPTITSDWNCRWGLSIIHDCYFKTVDENLLNGKNVLDFFMNLPIPVKLSDMKYLIWSIHDIAANTKLCRTPTLQFSMHFYLIERWKSARVDIIVTTYWFYPMIYKILVFPKGSCGKYLGWILYESSLWSYIRL